MTAKQLIDKYISFFEKRGHKRIPNSLLVPENDPTTLFTSSGMQPLVPYLLGEPHPNGARLVNVQNCFRAQDLEEVGDSKHTTFFRMLGNWSLGDPTSPDGIGQGAYFKKEQLLWFFEFLTKELGLLPQQLYVSVFEGSKEIPRDEESASIWKRLFENVGLSPENRIFYYGYDKNWWSRAGEPRDMPTGEPGGPDSEVFYDLQIPHNISFGKKCHPNCQCGRFLEIGNSVFMQYQKSSFAPLSGTSQGRGKNISPFIELSQKNVDFGGGLERLLVSVENQQDMFQTNLFFPIVKAIEKQTGKEYAGCSQNMRIITDHLVATTFIIANGVSPSNKEQGYLLRRLIRRGLDNLYELGAKEYMRVLETITLQYKETDPSLVLQFEKVKNTILQEENLYKRTISDSRKFIQKKYGLKQGDDLMGIVKISAQDAFILYSTHGFSPTQIKSLGFLFNEQEFAQKMKEHQAVSRAGVIKKFAGGLADHGQQTIKGHTATHLLHQALKDVLGTHVHQTGSNITAERIRFDFSHSAKLTKEQIKEVEKIVNDKIRENLPIHYEIVSIKQAKKIGAIGLFDDQYGDRVKVYFIGNYSKEFCGGPHVDFTEKLKRFKITKEETLGEGKRRIYAILEPS